MLRRFDPNDWKISVKGLIIVFLPLIVALVATTAAASLLYQSIELADAARRSRNIVAHADKLKELNFEAAHSLVSYGLTRSRLFVVQYEQAVGRIKPTVDDLSTEAKDDLELSLVTKLRGSCARNLALLESTYKALEENDRADISLAANQRLEQRLETSMNQMISDLQHLTKHEANLQKRHPYNEAQNRNALVVVLALGTAGMIVALLLALAFMKNITRRLSLVTHNAILLSADQPLNPPVPGADEISTLDRIFHETADALRFAQQKEKAIITNALDVICSIDAQGNFMTVSPSAAAIWGYDPDELIGMKLTKLLPDSEKEKTRAIFDSLDKNNASARFEGCIHCKDGTVADMYWSVQKSEAERSYFCIVQDISSRKEVERMKNDFVAMVSHDIRSPLTSLRGFLEMLVDGIYGPIPAKAIMRARESESSLGRLLALVNNILDMEKMESGKLSLDFSHTSINEVVKETVNSLQGFAEQQDVDLEFSGAREDIVVEADPNRLMQVVLNLVSNAIKFSPEGGKVRVAVSFSESSNGGKDSSLHSTRFGSKHNNWPDTEDGAEYFAEVSVSDEGRGVPDEFKEKIFERFQQVQDEDARNHGGAGLGLSICKRIIDLHGGTIGVKDAEVGSVFWFRIPLDQEKVAR